MKTTVVLLSRVRLITPSVDENKCSVLCESALSTCSNKDGLSLSSGQSTVGM